MKVIPFKKKELKKIEINFADILNKDPSSQDSFQTFKRALIKSNQDLEKALEEAFNKIKTISLLKK